MKKREAYSYVSPFYFRDILFTVSYHADDFAEDGELVDIEEEPDDSDEDFSDFDGDFEEE